jgi:hypothetical protein
MSDSVVLTWMACAWSLSRKLPFGTLGNTKLGLVLVMCIGKVVELAFDF